jgi:hypothetical protein
MPRVAATTIIRSVTTRRNGGSGARRPDPVTGNDVHQWLIYGVTAAVPGLALLADHAMWACDIPQHLPAGRWLAVAVACLYAAANLAALDLLVIGFGLASPARALQQPLRRPAWYFLKQAAMVIAALCVVNAPLTLCVVIAGLLT